MFESSSVQTLNATITEAIAAQIAAELRVRPVQTHAAIDLLDGGATVPFVARYRKEATGGLDDAQLRELEARQSWAWRHRLRRMCRLGCRCL